MATEETKKKKTTTTKKSDATAKENEALKAQVEAQNELMQKMQAQIEALMKAVSNEPKTSNAEVQKNDNRLIRFISLTDASVILRGTNFWAIEGGRYSYRDFPEREARVIALNMSDYLRRGSVYIDDTEFVRENDLETVYATLLSDKDLKELVNKEVADVIKIYQNVNDNQKEIIIDSIIEDKKAGKTIDNNILVTLGALSNRDLINLDDED